MLKHITSGRQDMSIIILGVLYVVNIVLHVVYCTIFYSSTHYPCVAILHAIVHAIVQLSTQGLADGICQLSN